MAKHLTKQDIAIILNIIHGFNGEKLTWEYICAESAQLVGKKPTRQSLYNNRVIREAYTARNVALKVAAPIRPKPASLSMAADRISRLQNELDTLKRKNDALLEQFVVWQYNAYKYGLKEHQLNEPIPKIDRERTEK